MGKKALLVGCNYPGTKAELKGCINDVHRMHRCLIERYGFAEEDITVLIDTDPSYVKPTGANIRRAVSSLVSSAEGGDFLFFHYSGHGTRLPAETGGDDDTGYDECIVPCDMNLITDDDFREYVEKIPAGCRLTIVSDSCHSGGLLQNTKEQIGNSTHAENGNTGSGFGFRDMLKQTIHNAVHDAMESRGFDLPSNGSNEDSHMKPRSLPLSTLIEILKQKTGKDDINVGKVRLSLLDLFGEDASPKVKRLMSHIMSNGGIMSLVGNLTHQFLMHKLENGEVDDKSALEKEGNGILISGCQSDQTSADANPVGSEGGAYGALSNAIQTILGQKGGGEISNRELVMKARKLLGRQGFKQRPGLYCNDDLVDVPFIC